ncbi:hypothetical protein B0T26DRAFT_687642 [Lasiosphaeria miniovina]|uniref:Uncharacterized protein n=1 Tax=Lasiosphaeria miniovina TaxID=1954250 RepID=A0AA40BH90_9PEZI|nr:uncharacterized protein B0T26DRAFT_687642 [Lasiosphaeria miniovina]KAK0734200.1 hypothetical protein B0T26DRAFT_687642 [Lasiosphaeria miniovina]
MAALRGFMAAVTSGTVSTDANTVESSSDWVEAMWSASTSGVGLADWIASFARSMTAEVRRNGRNAVSSTSANSSTESKIKTYEGSAVQLTPFVAVHWLWMLYPGALIMLAVYFLLHTMAASARDRVSVWKGGALPMLFCRVDDNIHRHVGDGMDVPDGLDERVGHIRVAMYRCENGQWGFRTAKAVGGGH